ncbi:luciferase family protein [Ruania alba]|uniref:luciferase domain-containing protein n=1 Tax=Ruania alba TaxID=648782 RepID=UPI001586FDAA|nr:luciferase family protein [Ruania alba]
MAATFEMDGVVEGHSQVSPPSSRAVFLTDLLKERSAETSLAPGRRPEPVHLHGVHDTSIHLVLPADRGDQLVELGWAEPHQHGDFGTEWMVYGPRNRHELEVILGLIAESIAFARGDSCLDGQRDAVQNVVLAGDHVGQDATGA